MILRGAIKDITHHRPVSLEGVFTIITVRDGYALSWSCIYPVIPVTSHGKNVRYHEQFRFRILNSFR